MLVDMNIQRGGRWLCLMPQRVESSNHGRPPGLTAGQQAPHPPPPWLAWDLEAELVNKRVH